MIHPLEAAAESDASSLANVCYQIVAGDDKLPAFNPLLMVKTVVLSPRSVKQFNRVVLRLKFLVFQSVILAIALRFATFAVPAPTGRILAPIAAILHLPGMVVFGAGLRLEYANIILHTFDFWFTQAASTLWAITLSAVLRDVRAVLVVACWINFTNALFQETYLRNTTFMVVFTFWEWLFNALLMAWLSLGLLDEVHHYDLLSTRGRTLSTKDLIANAMATMTMMSLRAVYRRYQHFKRQRKRKETTMLALGYRCKIALNVASSMATTSIAPRQLIRQTSARRASTVATAYLTPTTNTPPLQLHLAHETTTFDARNTVWRHDGALPLAVWKIALLYVCGIGGAVLATLSLFVPKLTRSGASIAVIGLVLSLFFSATFACCCQRQLLGRVLTSFHFLFLAVQMVSAGVCVMDFFYWRWIPACGVGSSLLLAYTILTIDALTPVMKRRLQFRFWMPVAGIILFWLVETLLLVDVLVLGNWDLRDRVFLDLVVAGRRTSFFVAPFLLGRLVTIFVWAGRYAYVALTRLDDNALVLLRGEVEFDYEGWKNQLVRDQKGQYQ